MTSEKRQSDDAGEGAKPKRPKTDSEHLPPAQSSPAPTNSTTTIEESPLATRGKERGAGGARGDRGRGGGRGGKGPSIDRRGKAGRGGRGGRSSGGGEASDNRSWGGRSSAPRDGKMREWGKSDNVGAVEEGSGEKKERFPKKKVAVLVGYNGGGYSGSQINPEVKTIEGDIFEAFIKAGAVSEDNSTNPQKVGLQRAARTDAGVHAAVNVLSLKLILEPPSLAAGTTIEEHINNFLPPNIRLWSILRVQGSFNPRVLCDQRRYEYTFPTHILLGPKPGSPMDLALRRARKPPSATPNSGAGENSTASPAPPVSGGLSEEEFSTLAEAALADSDNFWAAQPPEATFTDDLQQKRQWRISPAQLQLAKSFVKAYEGSHNYYNFTVGKDFRDRSCQRVMKSLEASDPFIIDETEYMKVTFVGQSFMLHQIRKMIGLAILAIRTQTPPSLIPETFGPSRIHVPKAPGLGLLLLEPQYVEYNKRVDESNAKLVELNKAGRIKDQDLLEQTRDHITTADVDEKVVAFKMEQVYQNMWEVEKSQAVFSKWLNYLDVYVGPDFEYLNSKGVIPQTAVFKKGENPEKIRVPMGAEAQQISDDEDILGGADDVEG
ncbi:pseudouridine synthase [Meredithblackwellia eburnea MCA 4105]